MKVEQDTQSFLGENVMKSYTANETNFYNHKHTVEVTFQAWAYKHIVTVEIGGNCTGFSILQSAVNSAIEKLLEKGDELRLEDEDDGTLLIDCVFPDLEGCVVRAEIVAAEREKEPVPVKWVEESPSDAEEPGPKCKGDT